MGRVRITRGTVFTATEPELSWSVGEPPTLATIDFVDDTGTVHEGVTYLENGMTMRLSEAIGNRKGVVIPCTATIVRWRFTEDR